MADILVIGAGPAGCMAARTCAQAGLRTVLLERRRRGRPKVCGGAISQRAVPAVGLDIPPDLIDRECFALHVRYRGQGSLVRQPRPLALLVSRDRFDEFLARQAAEAGADVRFEQPVDQLSVEDSCVRATTASGTLRARAAVIADGANSRFAGQVRPRFERRHLAGCLAMDIPADAETIERVCGQALVIDYGITRSGYLWMFPKGDHISAGLGQLFGDGQPMKETFLAYLRRHGLPADEPLRGAVIPLKAATERIVGDRLLLAGDAAGFVDAFTGEGIHFAMLSGMLAGQTLAAAASRGDFSAGFLDGYRRRCRDEFLLELLAAVRITNAMYRFPNLLLRTAVRHPEVVNKYLQYLGQEDGYRKFSRWFMVHFLRVCLT